MTIEQAKQLVNSMCADCEPKDNIRKPSSTFSNDKESNESSKVESETSKEESMESSKEEDLERAQKLVKRPVAEKSIIGKRNRFVLIGDNYRRGCRLDEQVSLDMESNPLVKQLQDEVKELQKQLGEAKQLVEEANGLREKLSETRSQLDSLCADFARLCEYIGFPLPFLAPNE